MKELWNNLIPNRFIGNITDATTGLVQFVDEYRVLQSIIKSATFYALAKGIISAKNGFMGMVTDIKNVSYAMNLAPNITSLSSQEFKNLKSVASMLSDKQLKLILSTNNLTYADKLNIVQTNNMTTAEAKQKLATLGITEANAQATASTFSLSGSLKYLYNVIAANPVMALTMAFTALVTIYQTVQRKQEEARQTAIDMANQYDEQAKAIEDLRRKYIDIVDSESDVTTKTEELNEWKQTLIETYNFEKEALENVNLEREKGLGLLDDEIAKNRINAAETWLTENKNAYEDAKKKLTSANNSSGNRVIGRGNVVSNVTKDTFDDFSDNFDEILKQLSISNPTHDNPLAQIKIQGSNTLQQYENLKKVLNDITSIKVTDGLNKAEEALYNDLLKKQKEYKKVVTDDIIDIYETGNKFTNEIKLFNFETDSGINFENVTQETYKEFRDKLLEAFGFGYKKDNTDFTLDIEQTLLEIMPDFEKAYRGIEDIITEETSEAVSNSSETTVKSLEDLQTAYDNISKSVSKFTSDQKTLNSALDEQKKHGELSQNTIQSLIDAGYASALVYDDVTGAVTLNAQAVERLNKQKKESIILEAEQQKSELEEKFKDEEKAIDDLVLEMQYANAERRTAIALEMQQHGLTMSDIAEEMSKLDGMVASLSAPEFDNGGSSDDWKTEAEFKIAEIQHLEAMGEITHEEYINCLDKLNQEYYANNEKYLDDFNKYEEEIYKARKENEQDLFNERLENLDKLADKSLEANDFEGARNSVNTEITETENRIVALKASGTQDVDDEIKKLEESLESLHDELDKINDSEIDLILYNKT